MRSQNLVNLVMVLALATADCSKEGDALYIWKNQLEDPNNKLSFWDPTGVDPCTWPRVTCNEDNFVTRVSLAICGVSGPLVPQLAYLTNLQYLEVFGNKLSGSIPSEIGSLKKLIALDLSNNSLSGSIPPSFGNLTSLQILRLNNNKLTGKVPEQVKHLQEWGNLRILNVTDNFLEDETTGTVVTNQAANFIKKHVAHLLLITCFYINLYFASKDAW